MRGAFDFEAFDWVKPFACALRWGPPGARQGEFHMDPARAQARRGSSAYHPQRFAEDVLVRLHELAERGVREWWAHNMGKYDGLILCAAAQRLGWRINATIAGGSRVITFAFAPPDSKTWVTCLDSMAVAPSSLRSCARDFELPSRKLFTEDDYSRDPRTWPLERLKAGAMVDADLVLELVERLEAMLVEWGGELKSTFSSSALTIVKADLKAKGLEIPSHKKLGLTWMNATARNGYYGARVEVLHHHPRGELTELDVCSSYPWAMAQRLPWQPVGRATPQGLQALMAGRFEGMVYARVQVPETDPLPPLPFKIGGSGSVFFPTGTWCAWFPAVELRYARARGAKVQPLDGLLYRTAQPFPDFIERVYRTKQQAKGALRSFAKLTLNGCYGKTAQKPERSDLRVFATELEARNFVFDHERLNCVPLDPRDSRILMVERVQWSHHTHFAVASYITALARMKLHAAMTAAQALAYVDSDSIHAAGIMPRKLPGEFTGISPTLGNELGEWKTEIPRYTGEFFAAKIYRLRCLEPHGDCEGEGELHLAAKGFPVEPEQFERLVKREDVTVERMRLLKTQLRSGDQTFKRVTESKTWAGLSAKRCPLRSGATRPWTVRELEAGAHDSALSPALPADAAPWIPAAKRRRLKAA